MPTTAETITQYRRRLSILADGENAKATTWERTPIEDTPGLPKLTQKAATILRENFPDTPLVGAELAGAGTVLREMVQRGSIQQGVVVSLGDWRNPREINQDKKLGISFIPDQKSGQEGVDVGDITCLSVWQHLMKRRLALGQSDAQNPGWHFLFSLAEGGWEFLPKNQAGFEIVVWLFSQILENLAVGGVGLLEFPVALLNPYQLLWEERNPDQKIIFQELKARVSKMEKRWKPPAFFDEYQGDAATRITFMLYLIEKYDYANIDLGGNWLLLEKKKPLSPSLNRLLSRAWGESDWMNK